MVSVFADWGRLRPGKSEVREGGSWTHDTEGSRSWHTDFIMLSWDIVLFLRYEFTVVCWTWTVSDSELYHLEAPVLNLIHRCFIPYISLA